MRRAARMAAALRSSTAFAQRDDERVHMAPAARRAARALTRRACASQVLK